MRYTLRYLMVGFIALFLTCIFSIGGCNNSSSNKTADALTIGEIDGQIVPAVKKEFSLKMWQEGDPENNIFLNGSLVSTLTQSEKDALNNSYQMGFFIALIDPNLEEIQDLHDVLGLQQLISDNGPLDIFAVSREFNVSGVRYFRLHTIEEGDEDVEPGLRFERERVQRLIAWAPDRSTDETLVRQDSSVQNDLTMLADSVSYTEILSIAAGGHLGSGFNEAFPSDFEGNFQGFVQGWSVHSVENDEDFYFFLLQYLFAPNTTLKSSTTQPWPCNPVVGEDFLPINGSQRGVNNYVANNIVAGESMPPVVTLLESKPLTTEGVDTTTSSISRTISGSVSYSQEEGAMVGVSDGVTYDKSQSYSSPSVTTLNYSATGPNENNVEWAFSVLGANAAVATFQPLGQWVWEAGPTTRQMLPCSVKTQDLTHCLQFQMNIMVNFYPVSCLGTVPPVGMSDGWSLNFPVPPLPTPTPTPTPTPSSN